LYLIGPLLPDRCHGAFPGNTEEWNAGLPFRSEKISQILSKKRKKRVFSQNETRKMTEAFVDICHFGFTIQNFDATANPIVALFEFFSLLFCFFVFVVVEGF
jgi:hypothetical protein